jgi:hypothetical protein
VTELTNASKGAFSSTLQPPLPWANTRLISGDAVEVVREMKREGNRSMRTLGSLSLCRLLLKAGLVDRFRVGIFPVITGSTGSERIYDGYPDVALDMLASRTFDGRLQLLRYGAGPNQSLENPLGVGGESLHDWMDATRTFPHMSGNEGGITGEDDEFVACGFDNIGAWIRSGASLLSLTIYESTSQGVSARDCSSRVFLLVHGERNHNHETDHHHARLRRWSDAGTRRAG